MKWRDTDKECKFLNYNTLVYYRNYNKTGDPFYETAWHRGMVSDGFLYPKQDLNDIDNLRVKALNPESTLYFDPGSGFPRFKLGLTDNKRCIKIPKADYIVVSGDTDYSITKESYVVIHDNEDYYIVEQDDWNTWFSGSMLGFMNQVQPYHTFKGQPTIIYNGRIQSYNKKNQYLAKYADNEYTVPFITDNDLDKICCSMCPEPTYDEFKSIIDMLDSDDASVVQLGIKMLAGYNVDKYKLSFRMILCTRRNWFDWSKNLVACKQLTETLSISRYDVYDNFVAGCNRIQRTGEVYTAEDLAIAKKLAYTFIKQDLQKYAQNYYFARDYQWLPDERTIDLK